MATRSNIGVQYLDGSIHMVYCHWDGYLSNNGKILLDNYKTFEEVKKLIIKGDISSLGETVAKTEYYVDKGEEIHEATFYRNVREAIEDMQEYMYLFRESENVWYVSNHGEIMVKLDQKLMDAEHE